jgi:hypothetical protein
MITSENGDNAARAYSDLYYVKNGNIDIKLKSGIYLVRAGHDVKTIVEP